MWSWSELASDTGKEDSVVRDSRQHRESSDVPQVWMVGTALHYVSGLEAVWLSHELACVLRDLLVWAKADVDNGRTTKVLEA
ncbi:hypothetical protein [Fodinicola acaciae]|uniref:hypothetical protein n=1 Tax=Fodinicola acaciae TaxID=2681555 RepID=UPI0013D78C38|nr:hypothetical protein [Fodinicola acaciae]